MKDPKYAIQRRLFFANSTTNKIIIAANIVFRGKTSDVTAYCQINGENENMPIENNEPTLVIIDSCKLILTTRPMHAAAIVVSNADRVFMRYATDPIGTNDLKKYTTNVNNGYPGGWAIPKVHPSATSSPESPPAMLGDTVTIYTYKINKDAIKISEVSRTTMPPGIAELNALILNDSVDSISRNSLHRSFI